MKAIAVFAGKGGVGKSSVSALLALALRKNHKVALLDADINTPSIPVLFKKAKGLKNIKIFSVGDIINKGGAVVLTGRVVKTTLRGMANQVEKYNPDICIIDMPPGTGDVQMQICERIQPSSFLLVLQPNQLAKEDALRAVSLFYGTKIPITGIIENMVGDVFGKSKNVSIMDLPVLASLPLRSDIAQIGSAGEIHTIKSNPLEKVAEKILEKASEVSWKQVPKKLLEGPTMDQYRDNDSFALVDNRGWPISSYRGDFKFIGTETWDYIRRRIMDMQGGMVPIDQFLVHNDAQTIRKMLNGLDEDNEGMFMVVRPPCTEVKLFPGEIGTAHLWMGSDMYYGVPSIAYQTDQGEVRLFPHEASPVSPELLIQLQNEKELVRAKKSSIPRYLPNKNLLMQIACTFGTRTIVTRSWKEEYQKLGVRV